MANQLEMNGCSLSPGNMSRKHQSAEKHLAEQAGGLEGLRSSLALPGSKNRQVDYLCDLDIVKT